MTMRWDDLRFVLALAEEGSLARAGKRLEVDHTTVGRRIEAAETALGVRLFTRTTRGYVATAEAEQLLDRIRSVEESVHALERGAEAQQDRIDGVVRVTSPETFGVSYLAPRLAALGRAHPHLAIELAAGGKILDLSRREADVAVRFFRSSHASLAVRRVAYVAWGLYAAPQVLEAHPIRKPADLARHRILTSGSAPGAIEAAWLARLTEGQRPAFVCELTMALHAAARAGAGVAVLPRYLGDEDAALRHIPMPDEPREPVWLTVHRDLARAPRVRVMLDFLAERMKEDRALLAGAR